MLKPKPGTIRRSSLAVSLSLLLSSACLGHVREAQLLSKEGFSSSNTEAGGLLEDSRDGEIYRTLKVGSRVWLAENLRYGQGLPDVEVATTQVVQEYGLLYSQERAKSVCPPGSDLPSLKEWLAAIHRLHGVAIDEDSMRPSTTPFRTLNGVEWSLPRSGMRIGERTVLFGEMGLYWTGSIVSVEAEGEWTPRWVGIHVYDDTDGNPRIEVTLTNDPNRGFSVRCVVQER